MSKCQNCGTVVLDGDLFCHHCGTSIQSDAGFKQPNQEYLNYKTPPYIITRQALIARNFWLWYLLSIVFTPLMYVYLYFNFEDLKKLDEYKRPSEVPPMNIDTNKILILGALGIFCGLAVFIFPYIYYLKFDKLYKYIEAHPSKQTRPPSGKRYIGVYLVYYSITVILFAMMMLVKFEVFSFSSDAGYLAYIFCMYASIGIATLIFMIYFMVQSNKWQQAYNEIAYTICPETIKQDLF